MKVTLRECGELTLPAAIRQTLRVLPGDEIEFTVNDDETVTLRARRSIPADQAWFWTPAWQAGEADASEDIEHGMTTTADEVETFLALLD